MRSRRSIRGFSVSELLTVVAIIGVMVAVTWPAFGNFRRRSAVRAAVGEIRSAVMHARSRAVARSRNCALKFREEGDRWVYLIYDDGDGDGVRNDDIRRGIDPLVSGPHDLLDRRLPVKIALPEFSLPDPDTNRPLRPGDSPVRFNQSRLCSFSPRGSGTSGSVLITDGHQLVAAVRVFGPTARVRMMLFDPKTGEWQK